MHVLSRSIRISYELGLDVQQFEHNQLFTWPPFCELLSFVARFSVDMHHCAEDVSIKLTILVTPIKLCSL